MTEEEKIENLISLSEQVLKYLQDNFHPHITVVIEVDNIRVEEMITQRVKEYAVN